MMQKKIELLRKTGHIHQVADVTPIEYREGRADKLSAWQVKNGPLSFTVMQGKGMDLSELSYKGINFSFLSKPGLQGRNQYDTNGQGSSAQHYGRNALYLRAGKYMRRISEWRDSVSHAWKDSDDSGRAYRCPDQMDK